MRGLALCLGLSLALPVQAQDRSVSVPSGTPLYVQEVVFRAQAAHLRLFLSPDAEGALTRARVEPDFDALCAIFLSSLVSVDRTPETAVIAIADRPVPFGEPAPEAVQLIEAYDIVDGACVWRAF